MRRILRPHDPGPRGRRLLAINPSQTVPPSKVRALGWAHSNPTSRETGAGTETTSPAPGGPTGRFSLGDGRLTPVLQRLAVTPTLRSEIAAPPSPRGRPAPTTPSTVPAGVGAYLRALPPGTPPSSHPQTQEEADTLLWSPPQCAADRSRSGCGRLGRGRPLAGGRRGRSPRCALTVLRSRPLAGPSSRTHDRAASSQDFAQNFALVACGSAGGGEREGGATGGGRGRREERQSDPHSHQSGVGPGEGGGAMR